MAAKTVIGPAHCEDHRAHRIGCLSCSQAVAFEMGDESSDLGAWLDVLESIGWDVSEERKWMEA